MIQHVKNIVQSIFPISQQAFGELASLLEFESYKKGTIFIQQNKRNGKEYFVLSGVCKSYVFNPEQEEVTLSFFTADSILSPHSTRISNGVSTHYFKALTDLKVASINAKAFEQLMIENLEIRTFGNRVLQLELQTKVEKEIGMASLAAKDRLLAFRQKYKGLENKIPHTDIASYLGITNISLSRLRHELTQQ